MFLMFLQHKLHMLKIFPEEDQQLRPKRFGALITKFVLHCAHACTLPRQCLKTLQRKNAPEEKNAPDVSLNATLFNVISMLRLDMPCYYAYIQSARFDSFPQEPNDSRSIVETTSVFVSVTVSNSSGNSRLCVPPHGLNFIAAHLYGDKQLLHRYGLRSPKLIAIY
jgi:hypothetical protein